MSQTFTSVPIRLRPLVDMLHREGCSLVLKDTRGNVRMFYKKGVRDLEDLLENEPGTLRGAVIADKVVGKAAAGMMAYGGVAEVYADVMSKKAIPLLEANGMAYACGTLVDRIVVAEGDSRCPLERIVASAATAEEVVTLLRGHFARMRRQAT